MSSSCFLSQIILTIVDSSTLKCSYRCVIFIFCLKWAMQTPKQRQEEERTKRRRRRRRRNKHLSRAHGALFFSSYCVDFGYRFNICIGNTFFHLKRPPIVNARTMVRDGTKQSCWIRLWGSPLVRCVCVTFSFVRLVLCPQTCALFISIRPFTRSLSLEPFRRVLLFVFVFFLFFRLAIK